MTTELNTYTYGHVNKKLIGRHYISLKILKWSYKTTYYYNFCSKVCTGLVEKKSTQHAASQTYLADKNT